MSYTVLLQASSGGGMYSQLIFFAGLLLVFYFFMIRPQQKRQKEQKNFRESIKKGDMIVTIGGLHGKIVAMSNDTVTLEADKGVKLIFEKTSISLEATKKYAGENSKVKELSEA